MEKHITKTTIRISNYWSFSDKQYYSTLILSKDNWDDFGYKTLFNVTYFDKEGRQQEIGDIKIYSKDMDSDPASRSKHASAILQNEIINKLPENFCSLGQDLNFYTNLRQQLPTEYKEILKRLNDLATSRKLQTEFGETEGVTTSLLRNSAAEKAYQTALDVLANRDHHSNMSFSFNYKPPYSEEKTRIYFDFEDKKYQVPSRINVIIGKNGTGKTSLLSDMANKLSGIDSSTDFKQDIEQESRFDKIITVSFSAFDKFKIPTIRKPINKIEDEKISRKLFNYVYCGLRKSDNTLLSMDDMIDVIQNMYAIIFKKERLDIWQKAVRFVMEQDSNKIVEGMSFSLLKSMHLSSGQMYLLCCITEIIANIDKESLILFDEPELHLHPNAISNMMRMFSMILDEYNSYAIFSTHSPILIQEIPSAHVKIIRKAENSLVISTPSQECFGNDLTNITYDIFNVSSLESNYKTELRKLSDIYTYDEIKQIFNDNLSISALMYLKNCCK